MKKKYHHPDVEKQRLNKAVRSTAVRVHCPTQVFACRKRQKLDNAVKRADREDN